MDDALANTIMDLYKGSLDGQSWRNEALERLRDVLTGMTLKSIGKPNDDAIDYVLIRKFIVSKNIDSVLSNIKTHMESRKIYTNAEMINFVNGRKERYFMQDSIRDAFCFRGTGPSGLVALYAYMDKLGYCPFEDGYRPKEIGQR